MMLKLFSGGEIHEDLDYNTMGIDPDDKEWRGEGSIELSKPKDSSSKTILSKI